MKKYLMLSAFVVFSVSQVTFANPELEGEWKLMGMACVDVEKDEVSSPVSQDVLPEDSAGYIKFTSDGDATGSLDIMTAQVVPTYSHDFHSGGAPNIELDIETCNVNGTYFTSLGTGTYVKSINATVDILSASGECAEDEDFDMLQSLGITLSVSVGGIDYFVESNRLYLVGLPSLSGGYSTKSTSYYSGTRFNPEEDFVDEPEVVDTDLDCGENTKLAVVLEKM